MRASSHGENKLALLEKPAFYFRSRKIKNFLQGDVLVDIGCGFRANLLRTLLRQHPFKQAIGMDLSVDSAIKDEKILLKKCDLNGHLDLSDASADTITSLAVLEHLREPETNLSEIYRILKPGGVLLLTTPSPWAKPVLEFLSFKLGLIDSAEIADHKNYFSAARLKELLMQAGFSKDKTKVKTFQFGLNNFAVTYK